MTTTAQQRAAKKLADALATDPFFSPDTNLDISGCPSLMPLQETDTNWIDPRFGGLDSGSRNTRDFRAFLEQETNRQGDESRVNLGKGVTGEMRQDAKGWLCEYQFQGMKCITRGKARDDAAMAAARHVFNYRPDVRELDDEELQLCAWTAQGGDAVEAASKYIGFAIRDAAEQGERILTNPKYAETIDKAVFFAWSRSRNDYSLSDKEFPKFLRKYARHKRLTIALCDSAFDAYKAELRQAEQDAPPPEPEVNLEDLSDDQITAAYRGVAREMARR
jgi:hypothetical protein